MQNGLSKRFSQADLSRITKAVEEAERTTSGEIVPCIVNQSDDYDEAIWRAGLASCLAVLGIIALLRTGTETWLPIDLTGNILIALLVTASTMVVVSISWPLRRLFAGRPTVQRRVAQNAAEAFLREEVFKTHNRTGILLFISLMEHEVVVLGDTGINAKVDSNDWREITDVIVDGMRTGRPVDGIVNAILWSGDLLRRHGFERRPDDVNELPDAARNEGG